MTEGQRVRVRFGTFEFDLKAGELSGSGRRVLLQEQPFLVLRILIEHDGELVSREEIQRKLWPNDTVVDFDHSINAVIKKLRRILGDSAGKPRYIETVARRGYRLMVPVEWGEANSGSPSLSGQDIASQTSSEPSAGRAAAAPAQAFEPASRAGTTVSHYRVLNIIDGGGMGVVYRAKDLKLPRAVAIKFLPEELGHDPKALERFRREASAASLLEHPNICPIYEFGEHAGHPFIVMQLLQGQTLRQRLAGGRDQTPPASLRKPLPLKELIDITTQVANGLEAAHEKGIIHRDIKPANIFLTDKGVVKIVDFGLAKLLWPTEHEAPAYDLDTQTTPEAQGRNGDETSLTNLGLAVGTAAYMSPEQVRGELLDARTDLFSLGAVVYEMATGHRAFPYRQSFQQLGGALYDSPVPPSALNPGISAPLEALIQKAMEEDPNRRYQSARELLNDLEQVAAGEITTDHVQVTGKRDASPTLRRYKLWLIAAALLLVAITVGWLIKRRWPLPLTQQKIMAVLPFDAVGGDAGTSAIGLGLTETLTAKLVQASNNNIQVVSARELRSRGVKSPAEARREFGTDLVLEGSLQQSGQTYRITCELVDSKSGRQLAARTITGEANDLFGFQDKVVNETLDMLPAQVKPEQRLALASPPNTQPAAYEHYIRGRGYLQEYEKSENIDNAITEFESALKVDPKYAPTYASLGEAYWVGYEQLNRGNEWLTKASVNCEKSLAVSANLAEGHACVGNVLYGTGKYEEAVKQYQQALELDPNSDYALGQLADAYEKLGNPSAAEAAYKKAISLRPNYWAVYSGLGAIYYGQARYAEAAEMFKKVTELAPDNYSGYSNLGGIYLLQGDYEDAISQLKRSIELRPSANAYSNLGTAYFALRQFSKAADSYQQGVKLDDHNWINWGNLGDALYWSPGRRAEATTPYRTAISLARAKLEVNPRDGDGWAFVATYYAMLGDRAQAQASLQRAISAAPTDPDVAFRAAIVYIHAGDTERCLQWLKKAVDEGFSRPSIRDLPDFDPLRENPQFRALVAGS